MLDLINDYSIPGENLFFGLEDGRAIRRFAETQFMLTQYAEVNSVTASPLVDSIKQLCQEAQASIINTVNQKLENIEIRLMKNNNPILSSPYQGVNSRQFKIPRYASESIIICTFLQLNRSCG